MNNLLADPLFQALFNSPVPRIIVEANAPFFTIVTNNDAHAIATNLVGKDIAGKSVWEIFAPSEAGGNGGELLLKALKKAQESNETVLMPPFRYDMSAREKEGMEEKWWQLEIVPVGGQNGKPYYLLTTTNDITDQVLKQQEIENSRTKERELAAKAKQAQNLEILLSIGESLTGDLDLQSVLQKITDATTQLCGAEFGAFFYNTHNATGEAMTFYTISGAPREAFERFGMPRSTEIFRPTLALANIVRIDDVTQDPRYGKNAPYHGLPKGHLPVTSYMAVPVISKEKVVLGSLFFGHKEAAVFTAESEKLVLSVSRQAAIALDNASLFTEKQELLKLAQEQSFKKDEFLSVASHELKTPVTSMKAYLQVLEKELQKSDNFMHYKLVTSAVTQVDKIIRLIGDLLNFSQLASGQMTYHSTHFSLKEVIDDCISSVMSLRTTHSIKVFGDIESIIYGDKIRIEQVLINLVDNAIKYSPKSTQVYIGASNKAGILKVEVRDFGQGIDESKVKRVFDRFYRGEENSFSSSGLGLGLYISLEIIKKHQGEMGVETKAGSGSTFWFTIPVRSQGN
ncbi:sensor histidine kinase [Desertivirga xinjiangensis]|uniref:sensor histidine kinase n=1 Tax=Desertivirga xinjiangensis TaxID=539206 RepID=UPI00210CD246|nr:ATP-binding protein [Pedobacter xinjiangensis]